MKIELIKEQEFNDTPWYSIKIDDQLVSGSMTRNINDAQGYYERLCKDPNYMKKTKEILKSQEIVVS
jgi:hypothetical protein